MGDITQCCSLSKGVGKEYGIRERMIERWTKRGRKGLGFMVANTLFPVAFDGSFPLVISTVRSLFPLSGRGTME
jgi:hypothetical protein